MFNLDELQLKKLTEWKKTRGQKYSGAIGGRFTYSFTPTSLGDIITVEDSMGDREGSKIDLSDYEGW